MMKKILILFFILPLLFSCTEDSGVSENYEIVGCPSEIKERAFSFARMYADSETEYSWGGQDPLRTIKIDCSGLIVMCYKYAMTDTKFALLADDMTSAFMEQNASVKTGSPQKGDLIFMGETGTEKITHIAIFEKKEDKKIYFIDATQKDSDGDGIYDIDGVTSRNYPEGDEKIKSFGIMKLKKYR
jgi:hypothetical protein